MKRQARLQNLFQIEKTGKIARPTSTCTETASHITPLSPWRGAGGEAGHEPSFAWWYAHKQLTLSPYNAVLPRLST